MKTLTGYVLGKDNEKFYSIVYDDIENKSYQIDCEYSTIGINKDDIRLEQKFNLILTDDMRFEFLDEYINVDYDSGVDLS